MENLAAKLEAEKKRRLSVAAWEANDAAQAVLQDFRRRVETSTLEVVVESSDAYFVFEPSLAPWPAAPVAAAPVIAPAAPVAGPVPAGLAAGHGGCACPTAAGPARGATVGKAWEPLSQYVLDLVRQATSLAVTWRGPGTPIEIGKIAKYA